MSPQASAEFTIEKLDSVTPDLITAMQDLSATMLRAKNAPSQADLERLVASEATQLFIARSNEGEIIGTLTLVMYQLPSGLRAALEDLAVQQFSGRRGLGSALVKEALGVARAAGATNCESLVDPGQNLAVHLFERQGFHRMSTFLAYQVHL